MSCIRSVEKGNEIKTAACSTSGNRMQAPHGLFFLETEVRPFRGQQGKPLMFQLGNRRLFQLARARYCLKTQMHVGQVQFAVHGHIKG